MKKNILIILFAFFFIGIGSVKASEYKCYYQDSFIDSIDPDGSNTNLAYYPCSDEGNLLNRSTTYLELTWNNGSASFQFYDSKSKIGTKKLCISDDDINNYKFVIDTDSSGLSITENDFKNGCPQYLYRIRADDDPYTSVDDPIYMVDGMSISSTTNKYYYEQAFKTPLNSSELWSFNFQNDDSYCYDADSSPELLINNDFLGSNNKSNYCGVVHVIDTPNTEDGTGDSLVKCNYFNGYQSTKVVLSNDLRLKFSKTDGSFVEGENTFNTSETVKTNFSITKGEDGIYECPNSVWECDNNEIHINNDCESSKQYSLIHVLSTDNISNLNNKCEIIGSIGGYIEKAYTLIRYLIPTLIVILSTADFAGVVFSGEQDKMEKAKYKFMMRLIIGVVTLLIPFLLELILKLAGVIGTGDTIADIACGLFG